MAIQQFKRLWGTAYYYGKHRSWPTRDGVIPFKRFYLDYADMWSVLALERLNLIDAVIVGRAVSQPRKGKNTELDKMLERHIQEAFPED